MKHIILSLTICLIALSSQAANRVIAQGLPQGTDFSVEAFFNFKTQTQKAWIQIQVGEWSGDSYAWHKDQIVEIQGLTYSAATKQVLYTNSKGITVVCANKDIFSAHHLKLTGRCSLNKVADGSAIAFDAR